jgi:Zn-dependent peptidase ImmA (M78 family)/transcriptional regulator with XRE-family HTH domain
MIAERIRQARLAADLTQGQLADKMGMTKQVISKYENGRSEPSSSVIVKLAQALSQEPGYFLRQPQTTIDWLGYRSKANLGAKTREGIQYRAETYVEQYVSLAEKLAMEQIETLPMNQVVRTVDAAEKLAASVRQAWSLDHLPIDDITRLVEMKGGIVFGEQGEPDTRFDGLSGWINGERPVIVLNLSMPTDRRRFSLAHELAHLLMDQASNTHEDVEKFANRFAGAFIVSKEAAHQELGFRRNVLSLDELMILKRKYGLSIAGWVYRARDLDIISAVTAARLWQALGERGWRKQEPVELKAEEAPTRLRQMVLRAYAEGIISRTQAEKLCPGCLPPVENKILSPREIMRLPFDERQHLLAQSVKVAQDEDFEILEAFGEADFVE